MTIFINTPRVFHLNNKSYMYLNQEFEGNLGVGYNPHDRQKGLYEIVASKNPDSYSHIELKPVILAEKHVSKNGDISFSRKNFLTGETLFADKVVFSDKFEIIKGPVEQLGIIIDNQIELMSKKADAPRIMKKVKNLIHSFK
ncbi:hypothetical protein J6I39_08995 [bacterium]|nr:hypothetical protein [bacterium]